LHAHCENWRVIDDVLEVFNFCRSRTLYACVLLKTWLFNKIMLISTLLHGGKAHTGKSTTR